MAALLQVGVAGADAGTDPLASQQWGVAASGASPAAGDGAGVTVAVIGGGVADHPDLPAPARWSCVETRGAAARCTPDTSRLASVPATHAAGVVAAAVGNGEGIVGIAPAARLIAVRVVEGGLARPADVDAALLLAADLGAGVALVVVPEGSSAPVMPSDSADRALDAGVLVIGGAGTAAHVLEGRAIAVDAVDRSGRPVGSAPERARWALAAPGGTGTGDPDRAVVGTDPNRGYVALSGTWVAAAHVAAAAAVLRADGLGAAAAAQRLVDSASASAGRASGRLDLGAARRAEEAAPRGTVPPTSRATTTVPGPAEAHPSPLPGPAPEIDAPPGLLPYPPRAMTAATVEAARSVAGSGPERSRAHLTALQVGTSVALIAAAGGLAALVRAARPSRSARRPHPLAQ